LNSYRNWLFRATGETPEIISSNFATTHSADKKDFRFLPDFSNHKIQISNNLEFICDLVLGFLDFLMSRQEMIFVSVSSIATIDDIPCK